MARFMTSAFDTNDFLANFRFGLALETEAEVVQMLDALVLLQARANRAVAGRPPKVAPGGAENVPPRKGKAPLWARRLDAPTPSYAAKAGASAPLPPAPPPTPARDSSPSAATPRWADVAAAAAEKLTNGDRARADWAHAPAARSRRASKEQARASARRASRGRGLRA